MRLFLSDPAKEDLLEIWEYVAAENPQAAANLLKTLREKFDLLVKFPTLGRVRNEFYIGLRAFPVGKYLILYQPSDDILEIVRVRHGATNLDDLFDI